MIGGQTLMVVVACLALDQRVGKELICILNPLISANIHKYKLSGLVDIQSVRTKDSILWDLNEDL